MGLVAVDERAEWLAKRKLSLGASEIATAMGFNRYKSPYTLWAEKVGLLTPEDSESEPIEWGRRLEPVIAEKYAEATGRKLIDHGRYAIKYSAAYPFLSCTLDREIAPIDERGPGCLEIKTTSAHKADEWIEEPPLTYQVQLQAQLLVTGHKWGSLAVLAGGNKFRWADIERNDAFIAIIIEKCSAFWKLVEANTAPPVDYNYSEAEFAQSTIDALKRLYPEDSGESIALPGEALEWTAQYEESKRMMEEAVNLERQAKANLMEAIGAASYGVLPDGSKWSFKTVKRKEHTVKASASRVLRRLKGGDK